MLANANDSRLYFSPMSEPRHLLFGSDPDNDLEYADQADHVADGRYSIGRISSEKLLGGLRELEIVHGGGVYRLRITSTGKLILTK